MLKTLAIALIALAFGASLQTAKADGPISGNGRSLDGIVSVFDGAFTTSDVVVR